MGVTAQHPIPFDLAPEGNYLAISIVALTFYDYMLLFDDELRYVWKGRKTWIFCLYILNRIILVGYQFWQIYHVTYPNNSKTLQTVGPYVQFLVVMFFVFSSDIFVTLRVCAVSLKNKALVAYFGTLALARLTMALVTAFANSGPGDLQFKLIPNTIGTTFDLSAILVIVWYTYRNKHTRKLSALARVLVAESTVYFLVMVAAQITIQISFNLVKGEQLPLLAYGFVNPILTLRFAILLRKSADPEGGQKWKLTHFNTPNFAGIPLSGVKAPAVRGSGIEMNPVDSSYDRV